MSIYLQAASDSVSEDWKAPDLFFGLFISWLFALKVWWYKGVVLTQVLLPFYPKACE